MRGEQIRFRRVLLLIAGGLLIPSVAWALQPPRPGEVEKLKAEGLFEQQLARAKALGNDKVNPKLVWQTRGKLMKAAGATDAQIAAAIGHTPPPARQGGLPSIGSPKVFVLLVDFPDAQHNAAITKADVESKFFADGDASQKPYESLRNYYQRASYNQLTIGGTVFNWYRAQHNRSYYEALGDGLGQETLMEEAINDANTKGHDFSQYDNDGDGVIDAFYIKWAGSAGDWASFWWAYQWEWHVLTGFTVDGKSLGSCVWSWAANADYSGINDYVPHVDIHETGHLLGLPDLYDYDSSSGPDGGVGGLDMMDANWGDHNCFHKYMLDWLTPTVITSGSQTLALNPSGTSKDCVLIMPGVTVPGSGTLFDEFFMAQYRKKSTGNDAPSTALGKPDYPASGFVVWHVDATLNDTQTNFEYDNLYADHKYLRLMEADGLEEIEQDEIADAGDFFTQGKTFSPSSANVPNSMSYAGNFTGVKVSEISSAAATLSGKFEIVEQALIVLDSVAIISEDEANGVLDLHETVTINITLKNVGNAPTADLVATLEAGGGVTNPNGPQTYGVLAAGESKAMPFTFTVEGECGGTVTGTLGLVDGAEDLGSTTFTMPIGKAIDGGYECAEISLLIVTPTSIAVPEGGTASAQAVLRSAPLADVVVTIERQSGDTDLALKSSPTLTFTPGNWDVPQTVTFSAAEDLNAADQQAVFVFKPAGYPDKHVTVSEIDNDTMAISTDVAEVSVPENGTAPFYVRLTAQPLEDVTVAVARSAGDSSIQVYRGSSLIFTPANWDVGQKVTLLANPDPDEVPGQATIRCRSTGMADVFVIANEIDDDKLKIVLPAQVVLVPEGRTAGFAVRLGAQPLEDLVVTVAIESGDRDITIAHGNKLTFTPDNWEVYQTVTLAAALDSDSANGEVAIRCSTPSLPSKTLTAKEVDNRAAAVLASKQQLQVTEGGQASFKIKLGIEPPYPTAVVVFRASGDDDITVTPSTLTFTSANWQTERELIVRAAEDDDVTDGQAIVRCSSDGWPDSEITVSEIDNDTMSLVVDTDTVDVPEGATAVVRVKLGAQPDANATVLVSRSEGDTDLDVQAGESLVFTPANWDVYQQVVIAAAGDLDTVDGWARFECTMSGADAVEFVANEVDDGVVCPTWFRDADADGWGVASDSVQACVAPAGYVDLDGDCDDQDSTVHPMATEVCGNNIDEDCDGVAETCPVTDTDGDGVEDGVDQCPGTPAGTDVNAVGCPVDNGTPDVDSDGDGVLDSQDNCPNTPAGTTVDANGCPEDGSSNPSDGSNDSGDNSSGDTQPTDSGAEQPQTTQTGLFSFCGLGMVEGMFLTLCGLLVVQYRRRV